VLTADRAALEALLLEVLAMPDVTGDEDRIATWFAARYADRGEAVQRIGHSVVVGDLDDPRPTVLLVGHLDVVPPTDADREPRRDGDRIVGRGASDMKSGLVAGMACFEDPELRAGARNLVLVGYAGEEGAHEENELADVLAAVPALADAALAIVLEPTDLEVQLGCLGGLHAELTFVGRAAHSARPWHGENALTKAGALLTELHERGPEEIAVEGMVYREVLTATQARTENARNVVPGTFLVNLNYRFAPDKDLDGAEAALRALIGDRAEVRIVDRAPPARPFAAEPQVRAFTAAVDAPVEPKQAWTDVASLAELGVPALNYGPGLTAQAHQEGEHVPVENLHVATAALVRYLRSDAAPTG
jgi:succinyl-diaminopimelate desuccinylase